MSVENEYYLKITELNFSLCFHYKYQTDCAEN